MKKIIFLILVCTYSGVFYAQTTVKEFMKKGDAIWNVNYKKRDSAIYYYTKALEIDSNIYKAYIGRGDAISGFRLGGWGENKDHIYSRFEEDLNNAIEDYQRAVKIKPNLGEAYCKIGEVYEMQGDSIKALENYIVAIKNGYYRAYIERGRFYQNHKKYEDAINDFSKAIYYKENNRYSYSLRVNCKVALLDFEGAISDYDELILLDPKNAYYFYNRAKYNNELQNYSEAINDFDKAIEYSYKPVDYYYYERGLCKFNNDDRIGAIQDFNKVIELNPEDGNAYYNRGRCKYFLDDDRGCILDMTKAIPLQNGYAYSYFFRGLSRLRLEYLEGAIKDFSKAIKYNGNDAGFYYYRGFAKYSNGLKEAACIDWSNAGEMGKAEAYEAIKEYCK